MAIKPVIHYHADQRPFQLDNDSPIVRKKIDKTTYENWANKTELTDFIDSLYVPPTSDTYLCIICQCGTQYTYVDKNAVPSTDFTCSCGRKVIKYGS